MEKKEKKQRNNRSSEKKSKKGEDNKDSKEEEDCQKIDNYKIFQNKLIGEGSFGRVFKAKNKQTNE